MIRRLAGVLRAALLCPVWVLQLVTGAKSFADNPLIGSRWLNARGLHVWRLRTGTGNARGPRGF
jgi:hypothetical protein